MGLIHNGIEQLNIALKQAQATDDSATARIKYRRSEMEKQLEEFK